MKHINKLLNDFNVFKDEENEHDSRVNPFLDDEENEDDMKMDNEYDCTCDLDVDDDHEADDFDDDYEPEDMEFEEEYDETEENNHDVKSFMNHMAAFFANKKSEAHHGEVEEDAEMVDGEEDTFLSPDMFDKKLPAHNDPDHPLADVMDAECEEEENEENFQGIIRTVKGANLVYKRKDSDGDFTELWIYNIGKDMKHSNDVKRAIVAGTDIDPSRMESEDGTQKMDLYSIGNVQYLELSGLPN